MLIQFPVVEEKPCELIKTTINPIFYFINKSTLTGLKLCFMVVRDSKYYQENTCKHGNSFKGLDTSRAISNKSLEMFLFLLEE